MLGHKWWVTCHAVHNDNCMYMSTCVVSFATTHLCTCREPQLVYTLHTCLDKMYLWVFFKQVVLHVLAELIARKITGVSCEGTYHYVQFSFKYT